MSNQIRHSWTTRIKKVCIGILSVFLLSTRQWIYNHIDYYLGNLWNLWVMNPVSSRSKRLGSTLFPHYDEETIEEHQVGFIYVTCIFLFCQSQPIREQLSTIPQVPKPRSQKMNSIKYHQESKWKIEKCNT